jgi:hypothetical protein
VSGFDDDFLPGWSCVCDEGDCVIVQEMLANHTVESEVVPMGAHQKYSQPTLWVRGDDYSRAIALIDKMLHELRNPPIGAWLCRCGEQIEAQFDICWKCGKDKLTVS